MFFVNIYFRISFYIYWSQLSVLIDYLTGTFKLLHFCMLLIFTLNSSFSLLKPTNNIKMSQTKQTAVNNSIIISPSCPFYHASFNMFSFVSISLATLLLFSPSSSPLFYLLIWRCRHGYPADAVTSCASVRRWQFTWDRCPASGTESSPCPENKWQQSKKYIYIYH